MKTAFDPRHQRRRKLVRKLYAFGFNSNSTNQEIAPIINNLKKIDQVLGKAAPEWPVNKLNKIDLAILRLALWELLIQKNTPEKVIIDEAVELAKEFGAENSPRFINGVLGTVLSGKEKDPVLPQESTPGVRS